MSDVTGDAKQGDMEARFRDALERDRQQAQQLRRNARAVYRAVEGWQRVRTQKAWVRVCEESREEYASGRFLLERLGAERYLDPKLLATLLHLRRTLIAEWGITTAAEMMLVDSALLSYYHLLRVQGWIGDLGLHIEHEFFGQDALATNSRERDRRKERAVEERVRRLAEDLMPLLDRANRMVIRNLKAITELRQGPVPAIAIGRAEQVTVTHQQNGQAPRNGRSSS
jgi:hypothetical protein